MITTEEKQKIQVALKQYVERIGSQNKASKSLQVSSATISQMINNNWELIADEMWRKVSAGTGVNSSEWQVVRTRDFNLLTALLNDAQSNANVYGVIGGAGSGKTVALKEYAYENKGVSFLQCNEFWNRKYFLIELLQSLGRDGSGMTVAEMMYEAVRTLKTMESPLIILDEADKLSDQVLYFFITLYNQLEDHCGIILIATDHLQKRINRGLKLNRKGYKEIFSRIGRKFVELHGVGSTDVAQICMANGITDTKQIKEIFADCECDLRRVKRKIHAFKIQD